ncbi:MAG: exosortase/archaeosortase family protein [Candidatus Hodarchaeales archaeon]
MPNEDQIRRAFIYSWLFKKTIWFLAALSVCLVSLLVILLLDMFLRRSDLTDILISFTIGGVTFLHKVASFMILVFIVLIMFLLSINIKSSIAKSYVSSSIIIIIVAWNIFEELTQINLSVISKSELLVSNNYRTFCFQIVDSCSGVYSILLFLTLFVLFSILTRRKQEFSLNRILVSGFTGILGAFIVNLTRIIILIVISFKANSLILESFHLFIGAILIIIYLSCFWIVLWSTLPKNSSDGLAKIKTN